MTRKKDYKKDYSKAVIYIIITDDGLYVGSTCDFKERKRNHKSRIYNEKCGKYNLKLYKNIRENDGEYRIEVYKLFPCENNDELRQEEERIMLELDANLNTVRAYLTEEEIEKYNKYYYEKNKDEALVKAKLYYENNRDEVNAKKKLYYENNRVEINAKNKLYYENNRDEISVRLSEKITCECGCDSTRRHITRHRKSKKHLNRMKEIDDCN